jgi:hypothetical protein
MGGAASLEDTAPTLGSLYTALKARDLLDTKIKSEACRETRAATAAANAAHEKIALLQAALTAYRET